MGTFGVLIKGRNRLKKKDISSARAMMIGNRFSLELEVFLVE